MIAIGDRVAYSAAFLRSTGQQVGEAGHGRGIVRELVPLGDTSLAVIDWEGRHAGELPERVNVANLAKVGPNSRFCAC